MAKNEEKLDLDVVERIPSKIYSKVDYAPVPSGEEESHINASEGNETFKIIDRGLLKFDEIQKNIDKVVEDKVKEAIKKLDISNEIIKNLKDKIKEAFKNQYCSFSTPEEFFNKIINYRNTYGTHFELTIKNKKFKIKTDNCLKNIKKEDYQFDILGNDWHNIYVLTIIGYMIQIGKGEPSLNSSPKATLIINEDLNKMEIEGKIEFKFLDY